LNKHTDHIRIAARLKKVLLMPATILFLCNYAPAQPAFQWARAYNGSAGNLDYGRALKLDHNGNAYLCGTVTDTGTAKDIAIIKYDGAGTQQWAAIYNGDDNGDDWAYGLVLDDSGNVYATGSVATATSGKDFITVKFDAAGTFKWARQYNGPGNQDDVANHIAIDPRGNVIVTGISKGDTTADDYATIKYSPGGTQIWLKRYNGPANDVDDARTMTADKEGNIYVSGGSKGISTDYDFATVKYDSSGNEKWVARYDGPLHDYDLVYYQGAVVADTLGNVYITGYSTGLDSALDMTTVKYDATGSQVWAKRFSAEAGGNNYADAISIDDSLNVYVTGAAYITGHNYDLATIKYDASGTQAWASFYNGTGDDWDEAYGVTTDHGGNVYIVGRSTGISTSADFTIIRYDPSGAESWVQRYDHTGYDWPFNISIVADDCIYAGGSFGSTISDMGILKYCQWSAGLVETGYEYREPEIFPNPAGDHVTISYNEDFAERPTISVYNIIGARVTDVRISYGKSSATIITSAWPPGLYICKMHFEGQVFTKALVVEE